MKEIWISDEPKAESAVVQVMKTFVEGTGETDEMAVEISPVVLLRTRKL